MLLFSNATARCIIISFTGLTGFLQSNTLLPTLLSVIAFIGLL